MLFCFISLNTRIVPRFVILGLMLSVGSVCADDSDSEDNNAITSTLTIEQGKVVGDREEIEIYDYHTGTYQSVYVYRKPGKQSKQTEPLPAPNSHLNNPAPR